MNKKLLIIGLFMFSASLWAQVDIPSQKEAFEQYKQQQRQQYQDYKDSVSNEFIQYLQQYWEELQLFEGEHRTLLPKPVSQPEIDTIFDTTQTLELPSNEVVTNIIDQLQPEPVAARVTFMSEVFTVDFYSCKVSINVPVKVSSLTMPSTSEQMVSSFWSQLNHEQASQIALQLQQQKEALRLNDWGLYDFTRQLAACIFPKNENQQVALTVYLLNLLRYDARMGRIDGALVTLLPTTSRVYDIPYTTIGQTRYYAFPSTGLAQRHKGRIYTYRSQLEGSNHHISMGLSQTPQLGGRLTAKPYRSRFNNRDIKIYANLPLMDFYAAYPHLELKVYANAAVDEVFALSIERNLKPLITGKSAYESVSILLNYVQTCFTYRTDLEQFGQEKNFFCEENFYYGGNDCEDRSVLFSYLVRQLVGLDVVLLEYPDHVAVAVSFPKNDVKGCYYLYDGHRYVVCDPTCKNAKVGQIASKHKIQSPKIIQTI